MKPNEQNLEAEGPSLLYIAVLNFLKVLLRHLSTVIGGLLLANGYVTGDSWYGISEAATGLLLVLAPLIWSNIEKWYAAKMAINQLTPHETNQLIATAVRLPDSTPVSMVKSIFKETTGVEKTL